MKVELAKKKERGREKEEGWGGQRTAAGTETRIAFPPRSRATVGLCRDKGESWSELGDRVRKRMRKRGGCFLIRCVCRKDCELEATWSLYFTSTGKCSII